MKNGYPFLRTGVLAWKNRWLTFRHPEIGDKYHGYLHESDNLIIMGFTLIFDGDTNGSRTILWGPHSKIEIIEYCLPFITYQVFVIGFPLVFAHYYTNNFINIISILIAQNWPGVSHWVLTIVFFLNLWSNVWMILFDRSSQVGQSHAERRSVKVEGFWPAKNHGKLLINDEKTGDILVITVIIISRFDHQMIILYLQLVTSSVHLMIYYCR